MAEEFLHKELTEQIIKAFYRVYNTLGYGFLEKVYENALVLELMAGGLRVEQQKRLQVYYENHVVGDYFADLVVEDLVIIELKVADALTLAHEAQLLNYLKATSVEVGLLFNFGPQATFRRKVFTNSRKKHHSFPRS